MYIDYQNVLDTTAIANTGEREKRLVLFTRVSQHG